MPDNVALQSVTICSHPAVLKLAIAQNCHLALYAEGKIVSVSTAHSAYIRAMAFSPDGSLLASVSDDKVVCIADASSGALLHQLTFDKKLTSIAFVDEGVVIGDRFGAVYLVENPSCSEAVVSDALGHIETVTALLALSSAIISADIDSKIRCSHWPQAYDIESFCFGHQGAITALCPITSSTFVSAGEDCTIRLWDVASGRQLSMIENLGSTPIISVDFDAANGILAFVATGSHHVRYCSIGANSFLDVASIVLPSQPGSLCFNLSTLFVALANSLCSLFVDQEKRLVLEAPHLVADEYMAATAETFSPAPFVFDEISRKKEADRRQEKRAKLSKHNESRSAAITEDAVGGGSDPE